MRQRIQYETMPTRKKIKWNSFYIEHIIRFWVIELGFFVKTINDGYLLFCTNPTNQQKVNNYFYHIHIIIDDGVFSVKQKHNDRKRVKMDFSFLSINKVVQYNIINILIESDYINNEFCENKQIIMRFLKKNGVSISKKNNKYIVDSNADDYYSTELQKRKKKRGVVELLATSEVFNDIAQYN